MSTRRHVDDKPVLGACQRTSSQRGDEPGSDRGGFAAAGWADYGKQPRLAEARHQLLDESLASKEINRVRLLERV